MALERRNPLPAGRYWIDLDKAAAPSFNAWRSANGAKISATSTSWNPDTERSWYLFTTTAPLQWHAEQWGWPNTAGAEIQAPGDVIQRPDPEPDFPQRIEQAVEKAGRGLLIGVAALVVASLLINRIFK